MVSRPHFSHEPRLATCCAGSLQHLFWKTT